MRSTIMVRPKGRHYPVLIGKGSLNSALSAGLRDFRPSKVVIISSPRIYGLYGSALAGSLRKAGKKVDRILISDREKDKGEKTLFRILKGISDLGLQRDGALAALGGGVVGDVTGLAAALYMRGIEFIQVPTTLLAQVDASIGGKTAIDFSGHKNMIGAFHQPWAVLVDPDLLRTLPPRQLRTGLAEVVKYGVIQDPEIFRRLEADPGAALDPGGEPLEWLIRRSCAIKAAIVSEDEKEKGRRAILNYGHTLGHALESYFHYEHLTHGEAIAYGMCFAAELSRMTGLCDDATVRRQWSLLGRLGLLRPIPRFDGKVLLKKMSMDKKVKGGKIHFILTRKIGLVSIQDNIPPKTILSALKRLQAEASELK